MEEYNREKTVIELTSQNTQYSFPEFYAQLELPADDLMIYDTLQKLRAVDRDTEVEINVINSPFLPELTDTRIDGASINELNILAEQLELLYREDFNALQKMNSGTLKGFADGLINVINAIGGKGKNNGLADLGKAGGIISAILTIVDILGDDAAKFFEEMFLKVGDTIEKLLQELIPEVIPAIIKGVLNVIEGAINGVGGLIGSIFGVKFDLGSWLTGGNESEVAETIEELTKSNDALSDRISDLTDVISDSPIAEAMYAYNTALDAQEQINKNNMEMLRAQMGYHSSHHSNAYYADDAYISSFNAEAQKAFQAAGVTASTINGLESIYNLTPEQLKAIKDFAPDLWKYLTEVGKYDRSEYWDAVVEQAGKTAELTDIIKENLTQTTFDSVYDGFKSMLMDMDKSAYDFSEDFEKYMFKAMLNAQMDRQFKERIKNWYDAFYTAMKSDGLDAQEMADLRKEYEDIGREGMEMREELRKFTGYGSSSEGSAS